ncbi:putative MARVEL domain-containing protein [Seiridium unicorne]|uniref:MARVEL domain-containing protein n=1 Tax=Seiridium unicorne TaxID=138068 RepID=A0ABR2UN84_9PEZI
MGPYSGCDNSRTDLEPLRHKDPRTKEMETSVSSTNRESRLSAWRWQSPKSINSRQTQWLVLILAICQILSTGLSLAIVGMLARALIIYNATKQLIVIMSAGVVIHAWPSDQTVALVSTYLTLGAAATASALGLVMGVLWCCKESKNRWKALTSRMATIALPVILIGLFVAALVLSKLYDRDNGLLGWSCDHRHIEVNFDNNEIGLGQVCDSMTATWDMSITVIFLEIITLAMVIIRAARAKERLKTTYPTMAGRTGYRELILSADDDSRLLNEHP